MKNPRANHSLIDPISIPSINTKKSLSNPIFHADSNYVSCGVQFNEVLMIIAGDAHTHENLHIPGMSQDAHVCNLDNIIVADN